MALPSSPPLIPEIDPPDSPPLLPVASFSISSAALERKRPRSDYGSLSSDPIFSDTTSDADEPADLQRPKRKRMVRGPWWNVGKQGRQDLRRSMAKKEGLRNADSGVWMGSDSSDGSSDSIVSSQQRMEDLAVDQDAETAPRRITTIGEGEMVLQGEALASRIVQRCVDDGKETVDLSAIALKTLSDATLKPLRHLVRQTFADFHHPPSEDEFAPLTPELKLFLSRNQLSSLPPELFHLTNITVLSLRNNELHELPPAIARLENLQELNIAGNDIRCLPWELLGMIAEQRGITVRPNPLIEPADLDTPPLTRWASSCPAFTDEEIQCHGGPMQAYAALQQEYDEAGRLNLRCEMELRLKLGRTMMDRYMYDQLPACASRTTSDRELVYLASSRVVYFAVDGSPQRRGLGVVPSEPSYSAVLANTARDYDVSGDGAGAPSMFELALRGMQSQQSLPDLVSQLENSDFSTRITSAMRKAASNSVGHGNESCSTCGRTFVIARAEWMEYWFNGYPLQVALTADTVLPFLRRTCSWACARPTELGGFRC